MKKCVLKFEQEKTAFSGGKFFLVPTTGLEPVTSALEGHCSTIELCGQREAKKLGRGIIELE